MKSVLKLPQVVRFIWRHPLSRKRRLARLGRFVLWQVGARLVPGPVIVPFVERTRLVVRPGMQGATGNVYTGLHEFDEMAFVLHCLREDDLFVDVGANVGTYTVLAAGVIGSSCVAMEPVNSSYERLIDNVRLNHLQHLVDAHRVAAGNGNGSAHMTQHQDSMNHVVQEGTRATRVSASIVPMRTLDEILSKKLPTIIKIDVEGFEAQVVAGALETLRKSSVLAVLVETNRNVGRVVDRELVDQRLRSLGYHPYRYEGMSRRLQRVEAADREAANTFYIRSADAVLERIRNARRFRVLDTDV